MTVCGLSFSKVAIFGHRFLCELPAFWILLVAVFGDSAQSRKRTNYPGHYGGILSMLV